MSDKQKFYLLWGGLFLFVVLALGAAYFRFCFAALFLYWPLALSVIYMQNNRRQRILWAVILLLGGIIVAVASYYFLSLIFNQPPHD